MPPTPIAAHPSGSLTFILAFLSPPTSHLFSPWSHPSLHPTFLEVYASSFFPQFLHPISVFTRPLRLNFKARLISHSRACLSLQQLTSFVHRRRSPLRGLDIRLRNYIKSYFVQPSDSWKGVWMPVQFFGQPQLIQQRDHSIWLIKPFCCCCCSYPCLPIIKGWVML